MNKAGFAAASGIAVSFVIAMVSPCSVAAREGTTADLAKLAGAQKQIALAGVPFVPNTGQWDTRAAFAARTLAGTLFVTTDGKLVYHVPGQAHAVASRRARPMATAEQAGPPAPGWSLIESFVDPQGASLAATPNGAQPATAKVSYLSGGDASHYNTGIRTYDRLNLGDVYTGVNVQLRATGSNVEKIFTVAPGQDPKRIHIRIDGATQIEIGSAGQLIAHTGNGPITYTAPVAYQEDATGRRTPVDVRYDIEARPAGGLYQSAMTSGHGNVAPNRYAFAVGAYDPARPLVIDPLLQSTYLGGSGYDGIMAMLVHPATGEVYVAGETASTPFPGIAGGAETTFAGSADAFVSRFSSDLTRLLQSTYLGGTANFGDEVAYALGVDPMSGDVYVAGVTNSTDFPGVTGGGQSAYGGGGSDTFVTRLSSDLKILRQSTYLGGSDEDTGVALAIHPVTGEVYVGGYTYSSNFPHIAGGARSTSGGDADGFVSRLNSNLTAILQSTYLGGSGADSLSALAIHPISGDLYAAGGTLSTNFPGTTGGAQTTSGGNQDGFVTRLNRTLTTLLQSTYLGGSSNDAINAIAIDPASGAVYVAGFTYSGAGSFPVTLPAGGAQATSAGNQDGFVSRLNPALTGIERWTYFGGPGTESLTAITLHPQTGEVYVTGYTYGTQLPGVSGGAQDAAGGSSDALAARLTADLSTIVQATFLGANGIDSSVALAVHPGTGEVYVAGSTSGGSTAFPGVAGGAQSASGGGSDGFISRLSPDLTAIDQIPDHFAFLAQSNVPPGSLRTSNAVRLTGMTPSSDIPGYVLGQPGSQMCHTDTYGCCAEPTPQTGCGAPAFFSGWHANSGEIFDGDYIQVRHFAQYPAGVSETTLIIGGAATTFRSSTGNAAVNCSLDVDANGSIDALTDGLILMRAMFGLTGTSVTNGAIGGPVAGRPTWAQIQPYLNTNCGTNFAP